MTFPEIPATLARLLRAHQSPYLTEDGGPESSLANAPTGRRVRIGEFLPGLSAERQAHLHAYGLTPGSLVEVVQHSPVTVVRIEHTELAMEGELARQVGVEIVE